MSSCSNTVEQIPRMIFNPGIDQKDELEEKMMSYYITVSESMNSLSDREINDILLKQAHSGQHDANQFGLLYAILVDSQPGREQSVRNIWHMMSCSRDAASSVMQKLGVITYEKWTKLTEFAQTRLLWIFHQMVKNSVPGVEPVFHNLLRQIAGGDVTHRNLTLIDKMLDIMIENRMWLDKQIHMHANAMAVYTFLRVMTDHFDVNLATLRAKEAKFCHSILTSRWVECMVIGRDLIRVLQAVARIPEIELVWKLILNDPKSLSPNFNGLVHIMSIKTPKRFLALRLTPDMESKLVFLTHKVKFGNHKRYQDWFQRQFLSTPESQSLRNDLIRFICAVIHPSNDMLQSDLTPRWAVVGWLLTTCTSNVAASTAKLALFWDWLFYAQDKENNIMNIEPAILVMQHSLKPHLQITIISVFHPSVKSHVYSGINAALNDIANKKVLPSLSALFDSAKIDKDLRTSISEVFPQHCLAAAPPPEPPKEAAVTKAAEMSSATPPPETETQESSVRVEPASVAGKDVDATVVVTSIHDGNAEAEGPAAHFKPINVPQPFQSRATIKDSPDKFIQQVTGPLRPVLDLMVNESDDEKICELTEKLLQTIDDVEDFDEPLAPAVASALCSLFSSSFSSSLLPSTINDESLEDSITSPLFVIFRHVCSLPTDEPSREDLVYLLHEMHCYEPRTGYLLLYFLKIGKTNDEKMVTYKDMANFSSDDKNLKTYIYDDLKLCQEDDMQMFIFLLNDIYSNFASAAAANAALMLLICSAIDGTQLLGIMCQVLQGHLIMFKKDSILSVLNNSLDWETIEQYFLWQLLAVHDIPAEQVLPILPKLEFPKHAEAITSLLGLLKQKNPTNDLMRLCLCRVPSKTDLFTTSILKHWAKEDEDRTAECLCYFLNLSLGTPKKVPRNRSRKEMPTAENILCHLDQMRQTCKNIAFLTNETIRSVLQQVQQMSNETQKQKFSELFALIMDDEDEEEVPSKRNLRQTAARRANNASPKHLERRRRASDSSSDSDEDDLRLQPARKKKKSSAIEMDDSD